MNKDLPSKMKEMQASLNSLLERYCKEKGYKFTEITADMPPNCSDPAEPDDDDVKNQEHAAIHDHLYSAIRSLASYMYSAHADIRQWQWTHEENHLPHPKSPSQMNKAIAALGMSDDVEAKKHVIWMKASRHGKEFEIG